MLANAVNAGILTLVEWPVVPHQSLLLWVIAMWIVAGARALLMFNYDPQGTGDSPRAFFA
jgi:hypothetical protein